MDIHEALGGVVLGGPGGGAPRRLVLAGLAVTAAAAAAVAESGVGAPSPSRAEPDPGGARECAGAGGRAKEGAGSRLGGGGEAWKEWALSSQDLRLRWSWGGCREQESLQGPGARRKRRARESGPVCAGAGVHGLQLVLAEPEERGEGART